MMRMIMMTQVKMVMRYMAKKRMRLTVMVVIMMMANALSYGVV